MYVEGTMKALQFLHIWPRLMQKCSVCHCDTSSKEQKCLLTGATWDKEMVKIEEFLKKLKADVRDEQTYSQEREKLLYADYQTRLSLLQCCRCDCHGHSRVATVFRTYCLIDEHLRTELPARPFTPESIDWQLFIESCIYCYTINCRLLCQT